MKIIGEIVVCDPCYGPNIPCNYLYSFFDEEEMVCRELSPSETIGNFIVLNFETILITFFFIIFVIIKIIIINKVYKKNNK